MKTYENIYYWKRTYGETVEDMLSRTPVRVPYIPEAQGEAVCFSIDERAYFTVSEISFGIDTKLYQYVRK